MPEIGAALREGGDAPGRLASTLKSRQRIVAAWAVDLMNAAIKRERQTLDALLHAVPSPESIRDPETLSYLIVWTLYWTAGAERAVAAMDGFPHFDVDALPPRWRQNVQYLAARRSLGLSGTTVELDAPVIRLPYIRIHKLPGVEMQVNGINARFLLDTGAPTTVLSADLAARAQVRLASESRQSMDGAGHPVALTPGIARVSAEGVRVLEAPVDVMPLSETLAVDGILSPLTLWSDHPIAFDDRTHCLEIGPSPAESASDLATECAHRAELLWTEGAPFVRARIDAHPGIYFLVDSGAGANLVSAAIARAVTGQKAAGTQHLTWSPTAASRVEVRRGFDAEVSVGTAAPEHSHLLVKDPPTRIDPLYPLLTEGYLGTPWFSNRRVVFPAHRRFVSFSVRQGM